MKRIVMASALAALAALAGGALARELEVRQAAEVEIETEPGHYYQLQTSTNFTDWHNVDDAIFGHGGRDRRLVSTRADDGLTHQFFRVLITDAPTNGVAPGSFAGLTINLDNQPNGDAIQFLTETNGVDLGVAPDPFAYTFTRTGPNEVRIETHPPTYYFDRRDVYLFTFLAPGAGTWVRDEFRKGKLKDRDVGVFAIASGSITNPPNGTNPPPVVPTTIPTALSGLAYTFQSGESPERLEFTSASGGTAFGDDVGDDEPNTFAYTYALSNLNAATLVITFKPGRWDEYALTYSSPSQGSFIHRTFQNDLLKDTDTGAFSALGLPPSTTTNPPPSGTMPTNTLAGITYVMDDGSPVHVRLAVASDTAGTEFDDSAPTQFTYTFTVTGSNTASLIVRFKAGKWDEYDLTFSSGANAGTFIRREFDKNELKDTDSGTFSAVPTS